MSQDTDTDDDLACARGVLVGLLIGLLMWAALWAAI